MSYFKNEEFHMRSKRISPIKEWVLKILFFLHLHVL